MAEGKVRHLGLSNVTAEQVIAAHQVHPLAAVQAEYSLWTRDPERELLPVLGELGIGFVPWSPLGAGFFAGSADRIGTTGDDFRANHPRFSRENLAANRDRFAPLRGLAAELGITPAQLALAWLLHQARGHRADPQHPHAGPPRREPRRRRRRPRRPDIGPDRRDRHPPAAAQRRALAERVTSSVPAPIGTSAEVTDGSASTSARNASTSPAWEITLSTTSSPGLASVRSRSGHQRV